MTQVTNEQVQPTASVPKRDPAIWAAAQNLEASFLSSMLQSAGLGAARDAFGGGIGEEQFSSMLAAEHAKALSAAGGIGLAESIYRALTRDQGVS
ncbi:MAG: rod-binding protein [Pseudomonadota bacterium]